MLPQLKFPTFKSKCVTFGLEASLKMIVLKEPQPIQLLLGLRTMDFGRFPGFQDQITLFCGVTCPDFGCLILAPNLMPLTNLPPR